MELITDLATAAYQRLAAFPDFQDAVLSGFVGTDAASGATGAEKLASAWLFQGLDDEGRPYRDPEGTGTGVVVLSERNEWASPNRHNTASFPVLQMLIYMDSTRNEDGSPLIPDASTKAKTLAHHLDRCFHLAGWRESDLKWGSKSVHSSVRGNAADLRDVPGTQSMTVRMELRYNTVTD